MPKMKTHSGASKRFRLTGSGKIMRRRANRGHLLDTSPPGGPAGSERTFTIARGDLKNSEKLLGL